MNGYNFTERTRRVLGLAREEAAGLHHEYVGTEHILLGLIREGEGIAGAVLHNLDVDPAAVRETVLSTVQPGPPGRRIDHDLPYTSRAKKVLELAMSAARELDHQYVGTEHLLLGLVREEKGIAAQVLTRHGAALEAVRTEIVRLLGTNESSGARAAGATERAGGATRAPSAASPPAPPCPRCGGAMRPGFVLGDPDERHSRPAEWFGGAPESSFWSGTKTRGRPHYPIVTYRCEGCGFLESYAREG